MSNDDEKQQFPTIKLSAVAGDTVGLHGSEEGRSDTQPQPFMQTTAVAQGIIQPKSEQAHGLQSPDTDSGVGGETDSGSGQMTSFLAGDPLEGLEFGGLPEQSEGSEGGGRRWRLALYMALFPLITMGLLEFMGMNEELGIPSFSQYLLEDSPDLEVSHSPVAAVTNAVQSEPEVLDPEIEGLIEVVDESIDEAAFENPYWYLPNELGSHPEPMVGVITSQQLEYYRSALVHVYTYQAYAGIQELRQARLVGGESVLFEALDYRKFWTRMEALFGLAEYGYRVDLATVERAVGSARSSLVARYLQRFQASGTPGELFILRQMLKILDAHARVAILEALRRNRLEGDELYLAAAALDPAPAVRSWLWENLPRLRLDGELVRYYRATVGEVYRATSAGKLVSADEERIPRQPDGPIEVSSEAVAFFPSGQDRSSRPDDAERIEIFEARDTGQPLGEHQDGFTDIQGFSVDPQANLPTP